MTANRVIARRRHLGALAVALAGTLWLPPATAADPVVVDELLVPQGFAVTPWAVVPVPTSLTWGPDTRGSGERLYVSSLEGTVYAIDDLGGIGGPPVPYARGLSTPLGVVLDPAGTLYVADSYQETGLVWGRVRAFRDTDADGFADTDEVVVSGLPNGRHNTNGMAFGPDGMLYVTNGNRTDDGLECGPEPLGLECAAPEAQPWSGSLLRVDPSSRNQVLGDVDVAATGFRNVYDVAFWPTDPSIAYIPMNGPDDPAADDVLYRTDVDDGVVDDMGFPSCLYNAHLNPFLPHGLPDDHSGHGQSLEPSNNLNPDVLAAFGTCPVATVRRPLASFGGHVSADGLAFAPPAFAPAYAGDLFVALWGNIWGVEDGFVSGHLVVRVDLDADGFPVVVGGRPVVESFVVGGLPLDLVFGADGAMYIADMTGAVVKIARVV